jgi:hypothetical protein
MDPNVRLVETMEVECFPYFEGEAKERKRGMA